MGIGQRRTEFRREVDHQPDLFAKGALQQVLHAVDELVDVHRLGIEWLAAREGEQPVGEGGSAVGSADGAVHEALHIVVPAVPDAALHAPPSSR